MLSSISLIVHRQDVGDILRIYEAQCCSSRVLLLIFAPDKVW